MVSDSEICKKRWREYMITIIGLAIQGPTRTPRIVPLEEIAVLQALGEMVGGAVVHSTRASDLAFVLKKTGRVGSVSEFSQDAKLALEKLIKRGYVTTVKPQKGDSALNGGRYALTTSGAELFTSVKASDILGSVVRDAVYS
jgi:hypothetical protein